MPVSRRSVLAKLLVLTLAVLCSSCGGSEHFQPVQGKVFYLNQPTASATVYFHPLDESLKVDGIHPCGRVQEDGSFQMTTHKPNDGAPAGRYVVTVILLSRPTVGDRDRQDLLPARYRDPRTSGLIVEVKEGANELEPFRLSD